MKVGAKLDASVAAGRIEYNPNDYDTCLTAAEAETCDQVFRQNGCSNNLFWPARIPRSCPGMNP